ncbi:TetR/AcrR family transcriptional regulator [Erythrobacter sp. JK5]|uniref:TetR/AcrR family transcriptional regulator n=1 Tax=Erythrobacter sp. JK5 TaxID=2829500 RepID=UPI001BA6B656|nr:TetR/AcrR family transcriptional regulator [Erythrobacter sp. JK5]QUL37008.1 TetR/AcrR family transcriptional regulator [Erythrobacter sp. JK5]
MNVAAFPTKGERTRAHIVATAASLFWRHSFHGVSVDRVALAADVNKATVYRYFADKRDLALAVVKYNGAVTHELIFSGTLDRFEAPQDRLAAIFRLIHRVHTDAHTESGDVYGCPIVGLALELGLDMPEIRKESQRIFDQIEAFLTVIASEAIALNDLDADRAVLGRTLVQLLHGAYASARLSSDPERVLDAGRAALALIGFPDTPILLPEPDRP